MLTRSVRKAYLPHVTPYRKLRNVAPDKGHTRLGEKTFPRYGTGGLCHLIDPPSGAAPKDFQDLKPRHHQFGNEHDEKRDGKRRQQPRVRCTPCRPHETVDDKGHPNHYDQQHPRPLDDEPRRTFTPLTGQQPERQPFNGRQQRGHESEHENHKTDGRHGQALVLGGMRSKFNRCPSS